MVTVTATPTATVTATPTAAPLTVSASVTRTRPIIGTTEGVVVFTMPNARVIVIAHFSAEDLEKTARADSTGVRKFWFDTATAAPGYRVKVDVRVRAHGEKRSSRTSFTPRQKPPPPPSPPPSPAPAPSTSAAAPAGCYPRASTGNCYQPGEFCPHADAGMHGIDGSGNPIICEDNDGLRWAAGLIGS